ncbi:hypothetical protein, partial [Maricaulis sp.]|uniref:hypothetical protein n=1 Tax=Maricaulis sp. TaxID=1486257 RepID=UPI0025C17445
LVECERDRSTTPEGWELFVEPVREMVLDRPEDEHLVLLFHGDLTSQCFHGRRNPGSGKTANP